MTVHLTDAEVDAPPDSLEELLTTTGKLATRLGAVHVTRAVGALRHRLADTTVRVAVLGGARTGRSTLCAQLAGVRPPGAYDLVDAPAIDGSLEDLAAAVARAADSDIVVFVVSANAALSRTETDFLAAELLPQRLARVILVVTHLDRVDEPERVLRSVRRHAEALDPRMIVLPGPGREPDGERIGAVGQAIVDIDAAAVVAERRHQVAVRLGAEVEVLTGLAEGALALQVDRAADLRAVTDQEEVWRGLRAALERRQHRLRDRLHGQIDDERDAVVAALTRDLAAAADPVAWWTAELPDRLRSLLLDGGRRLDETLAQRTADAGRWLELELRSQLGVDDYAPGTDERRLPAAEVTTRPPALPDEARYTLLRDLLRAIGPVLPAMLTAARAFRGKVLLVALVDPALRIVDDQVGRLTVEERRAGLMRQLPALVGDNLDAYQRAVGDGLTGYERAELDGLDGRWRDWRAARTAVAGEAAPDAADVAERARALGRQVHVWQTTIKGSHR